MDDICEGGRGAFKPTRRGRRREGRVEEHARELTALLEVARSLSSTLELEPLLDLILDQLLRVIDYRTAGIFLARDAELETVASRDTRGDARPRRYLGHRRPLAQIGPIWQRLLHGEPLLIGDVRHDDHPLAAAWRTSTSSCRPELLSPPVRTWMAVPLSVRGQVVGYLALTREMPGSFTAGDTELAVAFAGHAAVAIENARLLGESELRARELTALLDVSHNLGATLELERLLDAILDQTKAVADFDGASLMLIEGDVTRTIRRRAPTQIDPAHAGALTTPVHRAGPIGAMILRREPVIVDDVRGDSPLAHAYRTLVSVPLETSHLRYVRSWMAVPLVAIDRVIGIIVLSRSEPNHYTARHASLVSAIAMQAAAAIENARLYEQARALAGLFQTAASLTYDQPLGATLDALAAGVVRATGAVAASVLLLDEPDGSLRAAGTHGLPAGYMDAMERSWLAGAASRTLAALRAGRPSVLGGVREAALANPDYAPAHPFLREVRWDTMAIQPLIYRERVVGALNAYFLSESPPGATAQGVLGAIAHQATVAVENARLFDETERRVRELGTLLAVSRAMASTLEPGPLLGIILDQLKLLVDYTSAAVVTGDEDGFRTREYRGPLPRGVVLSRPVRAEAMPVAMAELAAMTSGEPLIIPDVWDGSPAATRYRAVMGEEYLRTTAGYLRCLLSAPMVHNGRLVGALMLTHETPGAFTAHHAVLAAAFAGHAAIALENARLYGEAHKLAALEERQRLARELHDSVSQVLYAIGLGASTTRRLLERDDAARAIASVEYVAQLAETGTAEMRALLFELRPESLEQEGLVAALAKQAAALRARHGIAVEVTPCDEPDVALDVKEALYRIAQEATHNTVKHARASRIDIRLACEPAGVALEVADDGAGFDASGSFPGHLGLVSMRERVERLNGTLAVESAPGRGTVVRVQIPQTPGGTQAVGSR